MWKIINIRSAASNRTLQTLGKIYDLRLPKFYSLITTLLFFGIKVFASALFQNLSF